VTGRNPGVRVGAYALRERLAVGGMSEVYLATNAKHETVVMKMLSERHRRDPVYCQLLRREGVLGKLLGHPNVVSVLDAGEDNGEPFVVLEYVDGVDLWRLQRALQHTMRRMEAPVACYLVRALLEGIAHVHGLQDSDGSGLIHRDVSPANILLSSTGTVKLGDLGISLSSKASAVESHSVPGVRLEPVALPTVNRGKIGYMAAEQLLGQSVDHRIDLFSAGVVLAEVLTGKALFSSGTDVGTTLTARDGEINAIIDVLGDHPSSLVGIVLRSLSRSPAERFQTADEFRAALTPHAGDAHETVPLLAALVGWARNAGKALARPLMTDDEEEETKSFKPPIPQVETRQVYQEPPDPERTREVPLAFYEVRTSSGSIRGRYAWARLLEMAFGAALLPDDLVTGPEGVTRRAAEIPEVSQLLDPRAGTTSEVAVAVADWADTLPGSTFLYAFSRFIFAEETGMLVCESTPVRREIYLSRGRPTHLASNLASEMLGEYLMARGVITASQLGMAMAMLPRHQGRLHTALVQLGILDEARVAQHCDALARERLAELFVWTKGTLRFFRDVTPSPGALPLVIEPYALLAESPAYLGSTADYFSALSERRVGTAVPPPGLQRVPFSPIARELFSRADGRITTTQLVQRVSADRRASQEDVLRQLYFLLEVRALEVRDR
jgi:eukaryotic-like serine/threonine-protein kinase